MSLSSTLRGESRKAPKLLLLPDFMIERDRCQAYVLRIEKKIVRLVAEGAMRDALRTARRALTSEAFRHVALARTLKGCLGGEELVRQHTKLLPHMLDFTHNPTVQAIDLPKGDGKHRQVWRFKLLDTARQRLLVMAYAPVLRPVGGPQYGGRGRGMAVLARDIQDALSEGIYTHAIKADIVDHYGSVDGIEIAKELRMPAWAAKHVLTLKGKEENGRIRLGLNPDWGPKSKFSEQTIDQYIPMNDHKGNPLPQGAHSSPLFAAYAISKALRAVGEAKVFVWADNILLLSRSEKEATTAFHALTAALKSREACDLVLHEVSKPINLIRGIEFVGFRLSTRQGVAKVGISRKRQDDVIKEARRIVRQDRSLAAQYVTPRNRQRMAARRAVEVQVWCQKVIGALAAMLPAKADVSAVMWRLATPMKALRNHGAILGQLRSWIGRHAPQNVEVADNLNGGARLQKRRSTTFRMADPLLRAQCLFRLIVGGGRLPKVA